MSTGIVMGTFKGSVKLPDRSLEYYSQENHLLHNASLIVHEGMSESIASRMYPHRRSTYRQSSNQSAVSGITTSGGSSSLSQNNKELFTKLAR